MKIRISKIFLTLSLILLISEFSTMPIAFATAMQSGSYKIDSDSINFAGGRSSSGTYTAEDTAGEIGTGDLQGGSTYLHAGYQQGNPASAYNSSGGSGFLYGQPYPASPDTTTLLMNVTHFIAVPTLDENKIILSWKYPIGSDIVSVRIVRSDKFFPSGIDDGEVIFAGDTQKIVDYDVIPGVRYYYALFAKNSKGEYSSGVLAQARIPLPGENVTAVEPGDPFASIPQAEYVDAIFSSLTLSDFDFIQDGRKIAHAGDVIAIDAQKNLTIQLGYKKVPEILKTIAMTLADPDDSSKVFTFLLRVNKDKTAYEATIASLERSGDYKLNAIILDYKNQGLKRLNGNLRAFVLADGAHIFGMLSQNPKLLYSMIGFLILAFILIILFILHARINTRRNTASSGIKNTLVVFLLITMSSMLLVPSSTTAAINKQINYQGKLSNHLNNAVSDGNYHIRFNLYTSGGTSLWSQTTRVSVSNGLFSVMLDNLTDVDFNQTLYLGVEIGGYQAVVSWDGEMSPRKIIGAVPAAFVADTLDNLSSEQFLRSDAINATSTSATFLTVTQTGSGVIANFIGQNSANVLSILSGGNVGIGTTSPYAALSVAGATGVVMNIFAATSTTATSTISTGGLAVGTSTPYGNGLFTVGTSSPLFYIDRITGKVGIGMIPLANGTHSFDVNKDVGTTGGGVFAGFGDISGSTNPTIYLEAFNNAVGVNSRFNHDLYFGTNDTQRMRLTTGGNLGIGTTTPNWLLQVAGTRPSFALSDTSATVDNKHWLFSSMGGNLYIGTSTDAYATTTPPALTISNLGFVGIGSSSPVAALAVVASSTAIDSTGGIASFTNTSLNPNAFSGVQIIGTNSNTSMDFGPNRAGGSIMLRNVSVTDGAYSWIAGVNSGNFNSAGIGFIHENQVNKQGAMAFFSRASGGSLTERLRIDSTGNLGIGTTTPNWLLQVAGTRPSFALSDTSATVDNKHWLFSSMGGNLYIGTSTDAYATTTPPAFILTNVGRLGLGTANPSFALDVNTLGGGRILNTSATFVSILNLDNPSAAATDIGGRILFRGGTDYNQQADIGAAWEAAANTNAYLQFRTRGSGTVAERMRITAAGLVGIGTTSPTSLLSVAGHCVTGDTKLRRRRRKKGALEGSDEESDYDYDEVMIQDIVEGDEIASLDERNGKIVWSHVNALMDMGVKNIYKLTTASGKTIRTTAEHPYFVRKEVNTRNNMKPRVGIFIDSSNLYHAAKKATWRIDPLKLKSIFSRAVEIVCINCHIAVPRLGDPTRAGILSYINALKNSIEIRQKLLKYIYDPELKREVKKGDIDVELVIDIIESLPTLDAVIIVSGDSDYLDLARYGETLGKPIIFLSYKESMAWELRLRNHLFIEKIQDSVQYGAKTNPNLSAGAALILTIIDKAIKLSSHSVDNTPATAKDGVWTKVGQMKEGVEIATLGENRRVAVWDKVVRIEHLPEEQVYDIEVEGTHNFIGNDIVAHNTYLSGNLFVGGAITATSSLTLSSVAINSLLSTDALGVITATSTPTFGNFNATSTVATSTISTGGFTVGTSQFVVQQTSGNVGIGTTNPLRKFVVQSDGVTALTSLALYNANTTNNNFVIQSFRGDTTGVGASTFVELAGIAAEFEEHDNATRKGSLVFSTASGGAAIDRLKISHNGNVGIGTTTPNWLLQVATTRPFFVLSDTSAAANSKHWFQSSQGGNFYIGTSSDAYATTTSPTLTFLGSNNYMGVGTTSPWAKLSVSGNIVGNSYYADSTTATSTFLGGFDAGPNGLTYDLSTAITSIASLQTGNINFDTNAGIVSWVDLPIDSVVAGGTVESYSANIGGSPVLTIYGQASGSGLPQNLRVGVGTTSPWATLSVAGTTTSATSVAFAVSDVASTTRFVIQDAGNVGIGTTSPWALLSVNPNGVTGPSFVVGSSTATNFLINNAGGAFFGTTTNVAVTSGGIAFTGKMFASGLIGSNTGNYVCFNTASNEIGQNATACSLSSLRYKENIKELDYGLKEVLAMHPIFYDLRAQYGTAKNQPGFIAEEAFQVVPNLVALNSQGQPDNFDYPKFTAVLAKAIQEQQVQIDALTSSTFSTSTIESMASSTSFVARMADAIKQSIATAGEWVFAKITSTLAIFNRVETQIAAVSKGLEMTDQATGKIYCVSIKNGEWDKQLGSCDAVVATTTSAVMIIPIVSAPVIAPASVISTPIIMDPVASAPVAASSTTPELPVVLTSTPEFADPVITTTTPGIIADTVPADEEPASVPTVTPTSTPTPEPVPTPASEVATPVEIAPAPEVIPAS